MSKSTDAPSTYYVTFKEVCGAHHQAYCTLAYESWYVNQCRLSVTCGHYVNDICSRKNPRRTPKLEIMRLEVPESRCDRDIYFV